MSTRLNSVNFVKILQGTRPLGAILRAKFHLDRCNVSPLRGEKPKNPAGNKQTRNQKQCLHRGTAIPAGHVTYCQLPHENTFPTYTRCSKNHNNTCPENRKIRGLKFDIL